MRRDSVTESFLRIFFYLPYPLCLLNFRKKAIAYFLTHSLTVSSWRGNLGLWIKSTSVAAFTINMTSCDRQRKRLNFECISIILLTRDSSVWSHISYMLANTLKKKRKGKGVNLLAY